MNDDALKKLWQEQKIELPRLLPDAEEIALMKRKMKKFDKTIHWRDFREVAACIVGAVWFGYYLLYVKSPLAILGCWILILSSAFIAWNLIQSKRRIRPAPPDASLEESIKTEIRKVENQIRLLRSVWCWYLLPIMIGTNLFFMGTHPSRREDAAYFLVTLALNLFIWWLNERAATKKLLPMKWGLESSIGIPPNTNMKNRTKTILLIFFLTCVSFVPFFWAAEPSFVDFPLPPGSSDTAKTLETIRKKYKFPCLATIVVKDGKICDCAAVGYRKNGDPTPVTTNDLFHIGSCTKSMTATLAAMFIEEGKMRWDTTIGEVFPELRGKMNTNYESVTVEQLLHHRGGVPGEPPNAAWRRAWEQEGTPVEQRREFIAAVLAKPPAAKPGTKMIYSNQGYAIAGAMLEKIAGQPWETLITEKLFKPLHMDSAGFGAPGTPGKVDEPWGHTGGLLDTPKQEDNPPAISPAGRVHCSLQDLARYTIFQMEGEKKDGLLTAATMRKLHTPTKGGDYACGWVCVKRGWAGGRALMHNGSNTMWYVVMWLAPNKDFSVIVATNTGADDAFNGCDDVAGAMIEKWLGK